MFIWDYAAIKSCLALQQTNNRIENNKALFIQTSFHTLIMYDFFKTHDAYLSHTTSRILANIVSGNGLVPGGLWATNFSESLFKI